jgi:hypothetical protein
MANGMENELSSRQQLRAAPLLQENNVTSTGENNNQHDESFHHIYAAPSPNSPHQEESLSMYRSKIHCQHILKFLNIQQYSGIMQARRFVLHPITRASVRRDVALSLVKDVNDETQGIINNKRLCIGLTLEDENPLTQSDYELYNQTMSSIQSRQGYFMQSFLSEYFNMFGSLDTFTVCTQINDTQRDPLG